MRVATIGWNAVRQVLRDRSTLFFTVLLPFAIILIIGTAIPDDEDTVPLGVASDGTGELGAELVEALDASPLMDVEPYGSAEDLERDARRGVIVAGVVIPEGYTQTLLAGDEATVVFIADLSRGFPAVARQSIDAAVSDQGGLVHAATFATDRSGGTVAGNLEEARRAARAVPAVGVVTESFGRASEQRSLMSGFDYTAPANLVLFVFITSLAASGLLIETRRLGVARRMYGTPTSAATIIAGETLGRFLIALFQAAFIVVVGVAVFGVDFGDPVAATVLVLAFVLVGTSFAMLLGTVFRNAEQAGSIGPPAGIAMGMLAGCMWPRFIMPDVMQTIGLAFPHTWAMEAWIKLIGRDMGLAGIATELAVLAAFSAVLLPVSAWRLRRSIVG